MEAAEMANDAVTTLNYSSSSEGEELSPHAGSRGVLLLLLLILFLLLLLLILHLSSYRRRRCMTNDKRPLFPQ